MVQTKMATRQYEPQPKVKVGQPPPQAYGFQTMIYHLNQLYYNPKRARQEFLHNLLPFLFEDPIANRRQRKLQLRKNRKLKNGKGVVKLEKTKSSFNLWQLIVLPFAFLGLVSTKKSKKEKSEYRFKMTNKIKIAEGGFGELYRAQCYLPDLAVETCAVKKMFLSNSKSTLYNLYNRVAHKDERVDKWTTELELHVLQKLQGEGSEFIVQYKHHLYTQGQCLMVLELCEVGDLTEIFERCSALPHHPIFELTAKEKEKGRKLTELPFFPIHLAVTIMTPIFDALKHMHSKGYIHRDVKPQNILLNAGGVPKLCDFGTAKYLGENKQINGDGDMIGSSYYMAPESLCREPYNYSLDTWQMGISMLVLIYGWSPYHYMHRRVVWTLKEIKHAKLRKNRFGIVEFFRQAAQANDFIDDKILEALSLNKPEFDGAKKLDWKHFVSFIKNCFKRKIERRKTCKELCEHEYIGHCMQQWKTTSDPRQTFRVLGKVVAEMMGQIANPQPLEI